ncbi:MAG: V-type ATP synthase subunit I [Verrucomicrobia bacterium]|nr:V-type ATP synthase subunit I [Verrucomicrobiota bacterium]
MIIDLKKYLFIGAKEDLAEFFIRAQETGFIEFITTKKSKELPEPIKKFIDAIKILRKQPVKEPYRGGGNFAFAEEVVTQVLDLTHEIEKLSEEKRFLEAEITRIAPFGQFSFEDINYIQEKTGKKIQFYCVKSSSKHEIEPALIYIGTDYDLDYYIGIHDRPQSYPNMIEMHFDKTADELKNHLAFVDETLHQVEAELKGFAGYIDFLRDGLLARLDLYYLAKAEEGVEYPIEGSIFSIEGWVPQNKTEKLLPLIEGHAIFFEQIAVEPEDKVPTCMENKKANAIGEDLVKIYDIPSANDKDPSGWVIWAFSLFFAMIMADGGYGLIFLALAFFLKFKFPSLKGSGKRLVKLLFILATSCIIWGVFTTSYFGLEFGPKSPLTKFSVLHYMAGKKAEYHREKNDETYKSWVKQFPSIANAKNGKQMVSSATLEKEGKVTYPISDDFNDSILFEFSILIGVIHVSLSLLRYAMRNWANFGWVAASVGGYLYLPATLKATSLVEFMGWVPKDTAATAGLQLLYGGLGVAIFLALIQKKWKGLLEIPNGIQIFSDILSYLRLYALALASSIMARTSNDMGAGAGLVVGFVIIILGHIINLSLGTMGGVIHGLRLNFIEWYHYCFEGEGKLFNPLRKLRIKQE